MAHLKTPPHNLDAEKAVLGSIMLRQDALMDVLDIIKAEAFYSERHKIIFTTMIELQSKGEPIDLLSLTNKLQEKNQIDMCGGASYLAELVHTVPSASNITHYAEIVRKKFMMRNLISVSEKISQLGFDEKGEVDEIMDIAEKSVFDLSESGTSQKFQHMKDVIGEAWEQLERLHQNKDEIRGVPTGFKEIDNKLAGLQKSDLIILAARPSVGKTSLALDMARHAAITHGKKVAIFSLEMSAHQLAQRMLSSESRVDAWKIRTGQQLNETEFGKLSSAMARLSEAPIYIDDQPGNNILKMRSFARRLKADKGLDLIIVDYLQLIIPTQTKNDNVVQQITEISRALKNLAREMNCPVLALSQLSRAVEQRGGKPRLSDLRDSGSIEQDADVVMFIHREDRYKDHELRDNMAEILIEKHRNGPTGSVKLKFDDKKASYLSIEKSDFGDFEQHIQQQ